MPGGQLYVIIGDLNVRQNMTAMNIASREAMSTARVIDCLALSDLAQAMRDVPNEAGICIVQSITSFLVGAAEAGTVYGSVDPVLAEFNTTLRSFASSRASTHIMVAPPMYRPKPLWYRNGLPQIAQQFSAMLSCKRPRNLHLLTSSASQELCSDGISLTPVAGLHYLLHLFDDAKMTFSNLSSSGTFIIQKRFLVAVPSLPHL